MEKRREKNGGKEEPVRSKEVDEHKSSSVQPVGTVVSYFRRGDVNTQFRERQLTPRKRGSGGRL